MSRIDLTADDLKCLSRLLSAVLNKRVRVRRLEEVHEGFNSQTHKKAILTNGRVIGLKAAERLKKGTVREYLFALTAKTIEVPGSGACGIFEMPAKLPLAGMQVVAREWFLDAENIGNLKHVSASRKTPKTAMQLGQWIWLCLYFGVSGRNLNNWIWSESNSTVAFVDYESWSSMGRKPETLGYVVRQILLGSEGELSPEHAKALLAGMNTAKESLAAAHEELSSIFANYGQSLSSLYDDANVAQVATKIVSSKHRIPLAYQSIAEAICDFIPSEHKFILVDDAELLTCSQLSQRDFYPFLEHDGVYWGPPANSQTAIEELERLRQSGADYIVFCQPAFWWLNYYKGFISYLRSHYYCASEDQRLFVFDLTQQHPDVRHK